MQEQTGSEKDHHLDWIDLDWIDLDWIDLDGQLSFD